MNAVSKDPRCVVGHPTTRSSRSSSSACWTLMLVAAFLLGGCQTDLEREWQSRVARERSEARTLDTPLKVGVVRVTPIGVIGPPIDPVTGRVRLLPLLESTAPADTSTPPKIPQRHLADVRVVLAVVGPAGAVAGFTRSLSRLSLTNQFAAIYDSETGNLLTMPPEHYMPPLINWRENPTPTAPETWGPELLESGLGVSTVSIEVHFVLPPRFDRPMMISLRGLSEFAARQEQTVLAARDEQDKFAIEIDDRPTEFVLRRP